MYNNDSSKKYLKYKEKYCRLKNMFGGGNCWCGCETSNIPSAAQASASVKSCVCNGHFHNIQKINIIEKDILLAKGVKPIFNRSTRFMVDDWYGSKNEHPEWPVSKERPDLHLKEQIDVPYFLPSENKSILTVCIPINTVKPGLKNVSDVDYSNNIYAECNMCNGTVYWNTEDMGMNWESECVCKLPNTMAIFDIEIKNLLIQDEKYSYKKFVDLVKVVCDTMESEISRNILDGVFDTDIEDILSFFMKNYNITMINDLYQED
jgi:hypothetical protein